MQLLLDLLLIASAAVLLKEFTTAAEVRWHKLGLLEFGELHDSFIFFDACDAVVVGGRVVVDRAAIESYWVTAFCISSSVLLVLVDLVLREATTHNLRLVLSVKALLASARTTAHLQ